MLPCLRVLRQTQEQIHASLAVLRHCLPFDVAAIMTTRLYSSLWKSAMRDIHHDRSSLVHSQINTTLSFETSFDQRWSTSLAALGLLSCRARMYKKGPLSTGADFNSIFTPSTLSHSKTTPSLSLNSTGSACHEDIQHRYSPRGLSLYCFGRPSQALDWRLSRGHRDEPTNPGRPGLHYTMDPRRQHRQQLPQYCIRHHWR